MKWWVVELGANVVLVAIVVVLGPLIKRFGHAYTGDIFHANPRTGKSYLVLMDVAYYLIFSAFVLFTVTLRPSLEWKYEIAAVFESQLIRVGGMLLLMGILHGLNVLSLPIIGRLLGLRRDLVDDTPTP